MQQRWTFLDHLLRQPLETPANRAMQFYQSDTREEGTEKSMRLGRRIASISDRLLQELESLDRTKRQKHRIRANVATLRIGRQATRDRSEQRELKEPKR